MRRPRASRPPRVPFERLLGVTPDGQSGTALLHSINLSLGGMFVRAANAPTQGTRLALSLEAAGRWLEFAEAEVAWVGGRGFGVKFTNLRPRARALVEHLVARGGTGEAAAVRSSAKRVVLVGATLLAVGGAALLGLRARAKAPAIETPPPVAQVAAPVAPPPQPKPAPAPELTATRPLEAAPPAGEFNFALPTGGVSSLRVIISDREVVVAPSLRRGSTILRVFELPSPARLVIDVGGREPKYSWQLEGWTGVKSVRIGARNHGTRVVVDLPDSLDPKRTPFRVVPPAGGV
jgi:hypothetical protein